MCIRDRVYHTLLADFFLNASDIVIKVRVAWEATFASRFSAPLCQPALELGRPPTVWHPPVRPALPAFG